MKCLTWEIHPFDNHDFNIIGTMQTSAPTLSHATIDSLNPQLQPFFISLYMGYNYTIFF